MGDNLLNYYNIYFIGRFKRIYNLKKILKKEHFNFFYIFFNLLFLYVNKIIINKMYII